VQVQCDEPGFIRKERGENGQSVPNLCSSLEGEIKNRTEKRKVERKGVLKLSRGI